jgi:two-component system NtrC family sensor kinase
MAIPDSALAPGAAAVGSTALGSPGLPELDFAQIRALLDSSLSRMAYMDRSRRHRYVNQEYAAFMGVRPQDLIGRTVAEVIGPDASDSTQPMAERALAGETVRWEGWLNYANGVRSYVDRVYRPVMGAHRVVVGYFVIVRDLTALKQREEELARRTETLEAILAHMAEGVNIVSTDGRVVLANDGFLAMYGFPARFGTSGTPLAAFVRHRLLSGGHYASEDRTEALDTLVAKRVAALLAVGEETFEESHANGRIVEVRRRRLPDGGLISTYTDITARANAEAEVRSQRDKLRHAERLSALGSLLAGVAHELNNPLSIVVAHASLLEEEAGPTAARAQKIRNAAERCARIVSTFLDMARRRPARVASVKLAQCVGSALDLVGYSMRTGAIEVSVNLPETLPPLWADADQVVQVLLNLLSNAQHALAEAPSPRRIALVAEAEAALPDGPAGAVVALRVADNGPGIPDALRARVFDPFFTTKPDGKGTGVGLSLCRSIVAAHGGSITVEDTPGGGCTVVLRLPVATEAAAPQAAPAAALPVAANRTALVIDDEAAVAEAVGEILATDGFAVTVVREGRLALEQLGERDFDVVFCDLRMPPPDGPAILRWLRQHKPRLADRLVFITGDALGVQADALLATTGRPMVEKPFAPATVREAARAILARAI